LKVADRKIVVALVAILTLGSISASSLHQVSAQGSGYILDGTSPSNLQRSTLDCASLGGSWSNATAVCTIGSGGSVGSGYSLTIDYGAGLVISKGAVLAVNPGAGIANTDGGTMTNYGSISNHGNMTNYSDGAIVNSGEIANYGGFTNYGSIASTPSATITNNAGGTITNSGTIIDHGTFDNRGTVNNSGTITSYSGTDEAIFFGGMLVAILGGIAYSLFAYRSGGPKGRRASRLKMFFGEARS
jgi:hypothetical protein